jgi:glycerophosphoryl diester phosphodiesterase
MFLNIGHRGACGYEPENTIRSFEKAIALKVNMIELDVHCCKTGELVVIHDETLERTTGGMGNVVDKTLDELKALDAGKGESIPTLEEVFAAVKYRCKINIELKGMGTAEPVVNLIEEAVQRRGWKYGDFLVSSFKWDELLHLKILKSPVRIGMLFTEVPENLIHILHIYEAYSVHFPKELITAELVAQMKAHKKQIYAFTVNEPADIEKMKALKVNGVFTNFPDRV